MLKDLVNNSFNKEKYIDFLEVTFGFELKKVEIKKATNNTYIETYQELGSIEIDELDEVGFFIVKSSTPNIENIRVGFNSFIGNLIRTDKYGYDALIVAIYHPKSDVWRLSYVALELDKNRTLSTKPKRFTFELGNVPTATALQQLSILHKNSTLEEIKEAFSVEKLSNDFFKEYKYLYYKLVENILVVLKKNRAEIQKESKEILDDKLKIKSYIKKMLGRIVFLYFVQKKGWLSGDKKFFKTLFTTHHKDKINFFDAVLEPLFLNGLNKKRDNNLYKIEDKVYSIPYLNGGLFESDSEDKLDYGIPNEDLKEVFKLFDSYNFTIVEHTPHDSEVAIDPEMLGRIFEDLLEDRKDKGAFYTPREIVHYMCQQSIENYMETKPKEQTELEYIKQIKILDPAIGSGAFPMGMLHEITEMRLKLGDTTDIATIKREVIQSSIYGVDIEPSAVEIAKLRFWLSIVVDEEIQKGESPEPLPNLAYKIMVGNSLIETINGLDPLKGVNKDSKLSVNQKKYTIQLSEQFKEYYTFHGDKKKKKEQISRSLTKLFEYGVGKNLVFSLLEKSDTDRVLLDLIENHYSDKIFLYKLFFRDVLNNGGFDVVIGNPPYVRHEKIKELKPKLKIEGYKSYNGTADLYIYFFEQGYRLLKENGVLSYITSSKYTKAKYGEPFREFILKNTNILEYIDFNVTQVFTSATVATSIFSFRKSKIENHSFFYCSIDTNYKKDDELKEFISKKGFYYPQNDVTKESFIFVNKDELKIKKDIENIGTVLRSWDITIRSGIKTGFNQAFIIDGSLKDELILKDNKNNEIIKPLLRGRDIKRYDYQFGDKWLINLHNNPTVNIEEYPSLKEYLDGYIDKLKSRSDKGNTPYNLRNCAYLDDFEEDKIMWLELSDNAKFTLDRDKYLLEMTVFFINGDNLKYLLALLNSKLIFWYFNLICAESGVGTNRWKKIYVEQLPIPKIKEQQKPFEILVDYILFAKEQEMNLEASLFESVIDGMVYDLYFEEEMKKGDCFISDEVGKVIKEFDNTSDMIQKMYKVFKDNRTIQRGLIYRRVISVVKIINGSKK